MKTTQHEKPEPRLLVRLWRGDIPLAKTGLIFGIAGGSVAMLTVILGLRAVNDLMTREIISDFTVASSTYGLVALLLLYGFFVSVATWRSATKHDKSGSERRIGGHLAKLAIIMVWLLVLRGFVEGYYSKQDIQPKFMEVGFSVYGNITPRTL